MIQPLSFTPVCRIIYSMMMNGWSTDVDLMFNIPCCREGEMKNQVLN